LLTGFWTGKINPIHPDTWLPERLFTHSKETS
jgi:hypothetical protein